MTLLSGITHSHYCDHQSSFICFLRQLQPIATSLFNLHAWQSFSTTSLQVLFGLPLGLAPSTSYSIHFFTQWLSSFCNTCPYQCNLFCCSTQIEDYVLHQITTEGKVSHSTYTNSLSLVCITIWQSITYDAFFSSSCFSSSSFFRLSTSTFNSMFCCT